MTAVEGLSTWHLALIGTPNSGKTALFNALTGSHQKVANYPGVTVERKAGALQTPAGRSVNLIDLPGTYSLRGRSPDEEITRDFVLGRLATEPKPDLLLCVADATNLRLALRLVIELKRVGRPMMLVLNMFDIATRRGVKIDLKQLSAELGVPVVTSVAVRRGGTEDLLRHMDEMAAAQTAAPGENSWQPPSASELRAAQREADRILRVAVAQPAPDTLTGKLDAVLLHPVAGLVILLAVLFVMFQAVFAWAKPVKDLIAAGFDALGGAGHDALPAGLLQSFVRRRDFRCRQRHRVPAADPDPVLLHPAAESTGLHGPRRVPDGQHHGQRRPVRPCLHPAVVELRLRGSGHHGDAHHRRSRDRLTTILVAPLMTCSARLPVYTLIIAAFIPKTSVGLGIGLQGLVMFGLYAIGIFSALAVAFVSNHFVWREHPTPPFMLELPDYKLPRLQSVAIGLFMRAKIFLVRAGTTIFSMMVLIWFLASFPRPPEGATEPDINYSLAAMIGHALEPILAPVGFNWQINVALIPGMAAREVAVAALGTVYAIEGGKEAADQIGQALANKWSLATALAVLAWYIFAPQCASTLAVIKRETGGWRWMWVTFAYMLVLAYIAAFATYHVAVALGAG